MRHLRHNEAIPKFLPPRSEVMPFLQVCRVSEFVDFHVSFPLKTLFYRTQQNDPVDDSLLNSKAADLIESYGISVAKNPTP
jgi:hypothetical protein